MTLRPPRRFAKFDPDPLEAALDHEVLAEKASTLGRLQRRLETALARLAEAEAAEASAETRAGLRDAAGEALWHVVIQRDLCGLRNSPAFFRDYRVPKAVIARMGLVKRGG